jgi:CRP-like cAMP-binding protein
MPPLSDLLKKAPFFTNLGDEATDFILARLKFKRFEAGTTICKVGDPGSEMYIIRTGEVKVLASPENSAEETVIARMGGGDHFGEMSLLTGEPRSASVVTTVPSDMYVLNKVDFDVIVERFPSITLSMWTITSRRLRATLQQALSAASEERLYRKRGEGDPAAHGALGRGPRAVPTKHLAGGERNEPAGEPASFHDRVVWLMGRDDLDTYLELHPAESRTLIRSATSLADRAFVERDPSALGEAHKTLYALYEDQVRPVGASAYNQFNPLLLEVRNVLESQWERYEVDRITVVPDEVPTDPGEFSRYFAELCRKGSMADHRLFEFLENGATRVELVSFFLSDAPVIVRFCDLVALTMVGADDEIRGELAENLWDEMGQGRKQERHVRLFGSLLEDAGIDLPEGPLSADHFVHNLEWSGLAGYNFYLFLCLHRRNQLRCLGALGAAESMDPAQYSRVLAGCRRVGFDEIAYYADHESMDVEHGDRWLENVLLPLVRKYPEKRHEIVLGAQMRINVTRDYYDGLADRFFRDRPGTMPGPRTRARRSRTKT